MGGVTALQRTSKLAASPVKATRQARSGWSVCMRRPAASISAQSGEGTSIWPFATAATGRPPEHRTASALARASAPGTMPRRARP